MSCKACDKRAEIKQSLAVTKEKGKSRRTIVVELKADYSHLNKVEHNKLKMYFVEAKGGKIK